jgi:predicted Zn finger-like uncharacterized protein
MIINCPSCQNKFVIADEEPDINKRLTCPHCHQIFEVTWLYPFTLDYLEEGIHNTARVSEGINA